METDTYPSLDQIEIATPCDASWDDMQGDDFVRRCEHCQLNVFNLSSLNRVEAEKLVLEREGRLCVRMFRRSDGTVLTQDCPVGLRLMRRRLARSLAAIGALVAVLTCGVAFGRSSKPNPAQPVVKGPLTRLIHLIDPSALAQPNIGQIVMGKMMPISNNQASGCDAANE